MWRRRSISNDSPANAVAIDYAPVRSTAARSMLRWASHPGVNPGYSGLRVRSLVPSISTFLSDLLSGCLVRVVGRSLRSRPSIVL